MLLVTCKISVEDKAYEGGVTDDLAFSVEGWSSGAPASFATSGRELIEMQIESAVRQAQEKAQDKLYILKGKK